jgi:hypothetical protein
MEVGCFVSGGETYTLGLGAGGVAEGVEGEDMVGDTAIVGDGDTGFVLILLFISLSSLSQYFKYLLPQNIFNNLSFIS